MDEIKAKQQVVEKIKSASKILVTVSDNPSVDALSAALGLTLLLDGQEKYATAIFSGETPPAIAFLKPETTFDDTTDSLRDFIIALNKEKADHLRYKVEGDAVKIFITPYKTTISQDDLEFSQGDYNIELVIALGVDNPDHLDGALENHGQILHDAAIITMTTGDMTSSLGGIDWHDSQSSSLSEMVAGLAEALKEDKKKPLLTESIATALLTGIVAETDRFSNEHTSSRVMSVAAQLMSAGADQQLISTELQKSQEIPESSSTKEDEAVKESSNEDGGLTIKKDGLSISHEGETLADLDKRVGAHQEANVKDSPSPAVTPSEPTLPDAPVSGGTVGSAYALDDDDTEPSLGGSLNATTEQAAEDARREAESQQNKTILSHAYLSSEPTTETPAASSETTGFSGTPSTAPGTAAVSDTPVGGQVSSAYAFEEPSQDAAPEQDSSTGSQDGYIVGGEKVIQPLAPEPTPVEPPTPPAPSPDPMPSQNPSPAELGLPLPPPLPDFSQGTAPAAPALPLPPTPQPPILGDILTQDASQQSVPPQEHIPPVPPAPQPPQAPPVSDTPPQASSPTDPGQFTIPGQQ